MEPFLTDTPFGLSILGGLAAALYATIGLLIGFALSPRQLLRRNILKRSARLLIGLLVYTALMIVVTYAAIVVFYLAQLPPLNIVLRHFGLPTAGVLWAGGVLGLFRPLLGIEDV